MSSRYPGYDVLAKRSGPSWDAITRRVLDQRLSTATVPRFFNRDEWATLEAICSRIVPQPQSRATVALAAMVDAKVAQQLGDGYRDARLPPLQQAWRMGLKALMTEAQCRFQQPYAALDGAQQDDLLRRTQRDELDGAAWRGMRCGIFFSERLLHDITAAYYAHPQAWNDIGFGGPASPRGYVRLSANQRDVWEAVEVRPGGERQARERNARVR